MISMLRKEACSGSIHDLAHIPTQNCSADCLTQVAAKADNLITAVKTGRLLDVDIRTDLRTLMEHKAFLSTWCRTFMFMREKVSFLNTLKISLAPPPQEGSFQVIFVGTRHTQEQKELKTCEREGHNATKITSAFADSCIQSPWSMMSIFMRILCLCLALMNFLFSIEPPSSNFATMAVLTPRRVETEDYYYETLAFSRRSITLELDEENMKSERSAMTPRNSGINPSTMKMQRWYPEPDRASDTTSLTGFDRPSYQAQEPIEGDEERLAMRQGDMPPPVPERIVNPRRSSSTRISKKLGQDASCHPRRRLSKSLL